jgi:hypothetical protein
MSVQSFDHFGGADLSCMLGATETIEGIITPSADQDALSRKLPSPRDGVSLMVGLILMLSGGPQRSYMSTQNLE